MSTDALNKLSLSKTIRVYNLTWVIGEPVRAMKLVTETLSSDTDETGQKAKRIAHKGYRVWTASTGTTDRWPPDSGQRVPKQMIQAEADLVQALLSVDCLVVVADLVRFGTQAIQACFTAIKDDRRIVFVSSSEPSSEMRRAMADYLKVFEIDYTDDQLQTLIQSACAKNTTADRAVTYTPALLEPLRGIRPYMAENMFLESLVTNPNDLVPALYARRAESVSIDSEGVLELIEPDRKFKDLIGLERAKRLLRALSKSVHTQPVRGCLFFGIPGCGKTTLAEAAAGETGLPFYIINVERAFGSLVGETEQKVTRVVRLLRRLPAGWLLFDEIEKGLSGSSKETASGDSGTAKRAGSILLKYLNDPRAQTGFHVPLGTSNNIQALPGEFTRAGRWDATFFFDLPSMPQLLKMVDIYREVNRLPKNFGKDADLDRMTGAEVEAVCRQAAVLGAETWKDAAQYVPIYSKFRETELEETRTWAKGRAVGPDDESTLEKMAKGSGESRKTR